MSLHKFAEQVASQGRGDDSLLVHMTPDEVRNLQQFAQANGTTLTINPTTGLPEAGLLSDLFKSIAPIALGAFLGPAGAAIGGGFMSAGMAGLATGGITALATGSLSRGLMAGLGAYGGAGLGESLMKTGTGALSQSVGAGLSEEAAQQAVASKLAAATPMETLTAGFNSATANPAAMGAFAKNNLTNIGMAAAPIMAGAMVPTTTKLPDPKSTGNIRQMAYNINPDTGRPDPLYGRVEMAPVKASEWGDKTFQGQRDLFYKQNPNPYELGVGSLNQPPQQQQQPTPMAGGGIVALAAGGAPSAGMQYAAANKVDVGANINKWIQDNPFATAADINNAITSAGLTQADVNPYLTANKDISDATRYALSHANEMPGAGGLAGMQSNILKEFAKNPDITQGGIDTLQNKYGVSNVDIQTPLSHGFQVDPNQITAAQQYLKDNPDVARYLSSAEGQDYIKQHPEFDASDIAYTHYKRYGEGEGRKWGAPAPVVQPPISVVPGATQLPNATVYDNGAFGNYGSGPATGVDYKGDTVSIATPGDIITNPDDTRTVVPNIPGRPYGGFTGMEGVKSAYTAGGGSLGYTAPVPKTPAEHNAAYNKMTDDSLDAYNFLMGKGKNLTQRKAETRDRPVMQRYDEAVLGRKIPKPVATTATTKKVIGVPGNPQSYFNEAEYLAANPDVAAELKTGKSASGQPTRYTSGYEHYLMYGKSGGRAFTGDYEGYLTAAALANAANAGGGGGDGNTTGPSGTPGTPGSGNAANSITGLAQDANMSIADTGLGPSGPAPGPADASVGEFARGGLMHYAMGGGLGSLGSYSDGGRLLRGPGDGVSDSIPATIGRKQQPARLADGEFVIPARIVSELGNGSTDAGAKKLYAMMDRVQRARGKTTGKNKVAANSRADKYLPA